MRRLADIPGGSLRWVGVLAFSCALGLGLHAQTGDSVRNPLLAPLQSGSLTVWIVTHNPNPRAHPRAGQPVANGVPQYQEKTMAEFGETAGSVGQTAGSVGQTVGSFGETAGSTGQTAGSTGQTAGSFGDAASTVGKNAGDAGQTVGSFGVSTTDLPEAAAAANAIRTQGPTPKRDSRWAAFLMNFRLHFPLLRVRFEDVYDDELQSRLETVAPADAPDVLLGNPLPGAWSRANGGLAQRYGVAALGTVLRVAQTEDDGEQGNTFQPEAAIVNVRGRSSDAARALYVWLEDGGDNSASSPRSDDEAAATRAAVRVMRAAVEGGGMGGDVDAAMATFDAQQVRAALGGAQGKAQIDVIAEHVYNGFAVMELRGIESGARAFGVVHALAVLRKDDSGRWTLLQLSPYLTRAMQAQGYDLLVNATSGKELSNPLGNESSKPLGISQASPGDGDTRPPQPDLWWDNRGGASMQVVEWAVGDGASNLFFVKDADSRLRTRVVARFATMPGKYRWRVWSVGADGTLVLSPWRTLNVVGQ